MDLPPHSGLLVSLVVLTAVTALLGRKNPLRPRVIPPDDYTIGVNVDMVVLQATVQDHKSTLVSGLDKDDFQIYEDGVLQTIKYFSHEDIPVTVGLVIDNSGSMRPKRHDVIAAALAFARSSNPQDQMFVVNFNERVSFGLPGNIPFTDQVAQLEVALSRFRCGWPDRTLRCSGRRDRAPEEGESRQESADRDQRRRRQRQQA